MVRYLKAVLLVWSCTQVSAAWGRITEKINLEGRPWLVVSEVSIPGHWPSGFCVLGEAEHILIESVWQKGDAPLMVAKRQ